GAETRTPHQMLAPAVPRCMAQPLSSASGGVVPPAFAAPAPAALSAPAAAGSMLEAPAAPPPPSAHGEPAPAASKASWTSGEKKLKSVYLADAFSLVQSRDTEEKTPTSSPAPDKAGPPLSPSHGPSLTVKLRIHWPMAVTVTAR